MTKRRTIETSRCQATQRTTQMTIGELIIIASKELKTVSPTPRLDAEVLLAHAMRTDRTALIRNGSEELPRSVESDFRAMLERRKGREPVHYIVGYREFWSLRFKVEHGVLIPRPETEIVVETALAILNERRESANGGVIRVADLGTGCGNIAVALAAEISQCLIYAVDNSQKALECARENAENSGVADSVEFLWGDLFEPLSLKGHKLDMIVSNPPYVSSAEMEELPAGVRCFEPHSALYGGEDGLRYLRRIIEQAPEYLKPSGALVLEIGCNQGEAAVKLVEGVGAYRKYKITKDYAGLDRVISALI